jgi:hypothetical protein
MHGVVDAAFGDEPAHAALIEEEEQPKSTSNAADRATRTAPATIHDRRRTLSSLEAAMSGEGRNGNALTGQDPGERRACAKRLGGYKADPGPPVKQVGLVDGTLVAKREDELGTGHLKAVRDRISQGRILVGKRENAWRLGAVAGHEHPRCRCRRKPARAGGADQWQRSRPAGAGGAARCRACERGTGQCRVNGVLRHQPVCRELTADNADDAVG